MSRIHLLRETWGHMSGVSGFDPLFTSLNDHSGSAAISHFVRARNSPWILVRNALRKLGWLRSPPQEMEVSPFVMPWHQAIAADCLKMLRQCPDDILLLSAGENQFAASLANAPDGIRKRIFPFLHQPPAWYSLNWRDFRALNGLGGIFVLCEDQVQFFRNHCDSPIHKIQHGVCLEHFKPVSAEREGSLRFVFVGQWLRDFETLTNAIPLILAQYREARFDLVIPFAARDKECLYSTARMPEVHWHAGVSPEALRDLYQNACALFLPLVDSTANNAILEAMSCGIPVITTDVGGAVDYLPEGAGILCPQGDATSHAQAAMTLLAAPDEARMMGLRGRAHAEKNHSWSLIAEKVIMHITNNFLS